MRFETLPRGLPGTSATRGAAPRALWMNPSALHGSEFWQYETGKVILGRTDGAMLGVADNRHLMTVAGSRSGKGTSVIVPNLLCYPGSVLVLDPKGENATLTAERRGLGRGIPGGGLGHDVYVIDPFETANVADDYRAGFNPLDGLDPNARTFIDDCDGIADALVVETSGAKDSHWTSTARLVLRGLVAWVASGNAKSKDLNEVRRLSYLPSDGEGTGEFETLLIDMSVSEAAYGIPAEAANMLIGMRQDERGSVLSTVRDNIAFLSSPAMAETLTGDGRTIDLKTWKFGNASVYLCLPAGRLHRHGRFFRLFLNRLLSAVEAAPDQPEIPALMILDEMHVLGHMNALETAAGLMAGFGVRIWSIWQDLSQLKDIYKARWETFMGNAGILQFFGMNDVTTLEYVSKRLGTSSVMSISHGEISKEQALAGFSGESKTIQSAPLLSIYEVGYYFSRQSNNQLIIYPGSDPIFLQRVPYWDAFYNQWRVA
ncbi:MAG: type IV secretory system conjugative DNA transfer family protein [Pseudomonadota bacterium]